MDLMTIGQAQKLTSPNPFALLSVRKNDGTTNVMAVSWWNYASNHPATVTVCLSSKGYSGQCIRESGAFGLNIVGEPLKEAAIKSRLLLRPRHGQGRRYRYSPNRSGGLFSGNGGRQPPVDFLPSEGYADYR